MRWMSLPIVAQLFYIWMYAGKLKSEIVTYCTVHRVDFGTLFLLELVMKTLSHTDTYKQTEL